MILHSGTKDNTRACEPFKQTSHTHKLALVNSDELSDLIDEDEDLNGIKLDTFLHVKVGVKVRCA